MSRKIEFKFEIEVPSELLEFISDKLGLSEDESLEYIKNKIESLRELINLYFKEMFKLLFEAIMAVESGVLKPEDAISAFSNLLRIKVSESLKEKRGESDE